VNDLTLFQDESGDEGIDIAFRNFDPSLLCEVLTDGQDKSSLLPQKIRHGSDEDKAPEEVDESDVHVIHVELFGLFFRAQDSLVGDGLGLFVETVVCSQVLLLFFDIGDQLAFRESLVLFGLRQDLALYFIEFGDVRSLFVGWAALVISGNAAGRKLDFPSLEHVDDVVRSKESDGCNRWVGDVDELN